MRKLNFYPHLAFTNILRNSQFYLPYLLTNITTIAMFYILCFISFDDSVLDMPGGSSVSVMLNLGCIVVGIFAVILLFYTNSFVMKRRKHELGLYSILGMESRHIGRLLCFEALILGLGSLICGLLSGIILSKLMLLLLFKLLRFPVTMGFSVSLFGVVLTAGLFGGIFLLILLHNLIQAYKTKPLELLRSSTAGEREPKTKWLMTLMGVLTLGAGYIIANRIQTPLKALTYFFLAVILVIIGTYCLFIAGSIAVLKLLRANKKYYYKPQHFTAVSGLLYRMKQNAVGLASICILSTMLLVTVSTTVCLYVGVDASLDVIYSTDLYCSVSLENNLSTEEVAHQIRDAATQKGLKQEDLLDYTSLNLSAIMKDDATLTLGSDTQADSNYCALFIITAQEYARHSENTVSLKKDEVLCYGAESTLANTFSVDGRTFHIAQRMKQAPLSFFEGNRYSNVQYLVVADDQVMQDLTALQDKVQGFHNNICYTQTFNVSGSDQDALAFCEAMPNVLDSFQTAYSYGGRQANEQEFYANYGCFLFLGLFLGLLFLLGTVLIIYYKQVSEGYEDQKRFEIMQKVGLSKKEVRRSVHSQVLLVFFLPLLVAMLHVLAAYHMITKLLALFQQISITSIFLPCTLITLLVFAIIYALVYWGTARTYYKIVQVSNDSPTF